MTSEQKLDALAKKFHHWRTIVKRHNSEPYPDELLIEARVLASELGVSHVCAATGVYAARLRPEQSEKNQNATIPRRKYVKIAQPRCDRIVFELPGGGRLACEVESAAQLVRDIIVGV